MYPVDDLFAAYARGFEANREAEMTLPEYLEACRDNPMMYSTATERLLAAIGEPEMVDTAKDARLGRIFMNRTIRVYPAFAEFYGMEETIERIVGFFRHAAQGLEERKQIMYLLGPVGGGKSSLAERLKALMEKHPDLCPEGRQGNQPGVRKPARPVRSERMGDMLEKRYGIPQRRLTGLMSPWCDQAARRVRRRHLTIHRGRKLQPSRLRQIGIAKTEPGDENNQDISSLVGKVDIRKLELLRQNDADAYSYSGGLNRAKQGILEFVEMFKAPIKMLHPLLTATQESNYIGTENIGAIPFSGHHPRPFQRGGMADLQEQPQQRSLHRPHLRHQGAVLPARRPKSRRSTRSSCRSSELRRRALRAGDARDAGALLRAVAPASRTRTPTCSRRCGSMTARA